MNSMIPKEQEIYREYTPHGDRRLREIIMMMMNIICNRRRIMYEETFYGVKLYRLSLFLSRVNRNPAKREAQISSVVTEQLISAFGFTL